MSESIYVRARDGALYQDPVLSFPEGFISFNETGQTVVVLWLDKDDFEGLPQASVLGVLRRVLRLGLSVSFSESSVICLGLSARCHPGADPSKPQNSIAFRFSLTARIPRPTLHAGTERHASRLRSHIVLDWPASSYDTLHLEIPKETKEKS